MNVIGDTGIDPRPRSSNVNCHQQHRHRPPPKSSTVNVISNTGTVFAREIAPSLRNPLGSPSP